MTLAGRKRVRIWDVLEQGPFGELGIPALVVSLVLFVSAMTLLGANVSELRAGYARVQQTNEALLQIAMVNADILRIEMAVRGYVLSGDTAYLNWQKMAKDARQKRLSAFDQLSANDPVQRANVATLKTLLESQYAYFDQLAKRVPTDRNAVIAEIVDYSKKVKRKPIEDMLVTMRDDEMRRLGQEQHEAETRVVEAYRDAIAISSLALLFGATGFALVLRNRHTDRRRMT